MGRTLQGTAESPHPWLTTRHPISRDRTARQLRQTHRGRDQADHHDSEKWEDCRAGRDTSRSHQSRHRDSCQQGDTDRDVTLRIFKARAAFVMLKNIWTSGGISVRTKLLMSSSSSTPMWNQSCSTDVRHGGQHRRCNKRSRHSSTPILDAFTKSNGKGRSEMKICGSERDWNCCRDCLYRIDWLDRSRLFQKTIDSCIGFSTHFTTCVVAVDLESNRRFLI